MAIHESSCAGVCGPVENRITIARSGWPNCSNTRTGISDMIKEAHAMAKLGNAFMSLFLDKRARESLKAAKAGQPATDPQTAPPPAPPPTVPAPKPQPHPTQDEINARLDEAVEARARNAASPDRRALIEQARKIHADKSKMLDDLPEEQQRKLKAMALMALMKPPAGR